MRAKQSVYETACLVRDFPEVFDALYARTYAPPESKAQRKRRDFHGWREATREARINRISQRGSGRRR